MSHHSLELPNLTLVHRGKTRDTYDLDGGRLLVVASDRIFTHNIVHLSAVPRKGQVLTALTIFWLTEVLQSMPHHLIAYGRDIYDYLPISMKDGPEDLPLRAIVVRRLDIHPREFIHRAYLTGSLYDNFYSKRIPNPYGIDLPRGLPKMYKFAEPIFTPTEKSETDDPVNAEDTKQEYNVPYKLSLEGFNRTRAYANSRGVEILDGKGEIGFDASSRHHIADEVATPDSNRFALLDQIEEGKDPPWLDKQIARDEAERIWNEGKRGPLLFAPLLTVRLVDAYEELFLLLTGTKLREFQRDRLL